MEQIKAATTGGGAGAEQSNGAATAAALLTQQQQQRVGDNQCGGREKKKRRTRKDEHMTEERIDHFISVRQEIESKGHEIEDEEFDLNDEGAFEACVTRLKMWDQCLDNAVRLEQRLLPHVIFDDAEDEAQKNDLIDVIQRVEPVIITNSGLEPLNAKLTEFINNPLSSLDSGDVPLPRAITSINHVAPSFDKIKQMVEDIRAQGDCPLVDLLAPADNLTVYDSFVCKVLADLLDILKRQRFHTNVQLIERDARAREQHQQQQRGHSAATTCSGSTSAGHDGSMAGAEEEDPMMMVAGPSSAEQYNAIATSSSVHGTSTHEKFLEAIQKGEIQPEGDDVVADAEDLGDAEDDESHSEAGSEDYTESTHSSAVDAAVPVCNTTEQQLVSPTNAVMGEGSDDRMETEEDGHSSATTTEAPQVQQQQQQQQSPAPSQPSDSNAKPSATPVTTSQTKPIAVLSSSEKVRLQQHQLNKLFSSAACLRSSPPLPPSSPSSVIKSEIIDLTLDDDNDDDDSCLDDNDDLKIIAEVIEDEEMEEEDNNGEDVGNSHRFETLSSSESPVPCAEVLRAVSKVTMNGSGGRRKRKSEDEEEAETGTGATMDGKRRRRSKTEEDNDDDVVETVEEDDTDKDGQLDEDSTDVVEDSDDDDDDDNNGNGKGKASKREGPSSAVVTTLWEDDEEKKVTKTNMPSADEGHGHHGQQQLMEDEDSIICLSDG